MVEPNWFKNSFYSPPNYTKLGNFGNLIFFCKKCKNLQVPTHSLQKCKTLSRFFLNRFNPNRSILPQKMGVKWTYEFFLIKLFGPLNIIKNSKSIWHFVGIWSNVESFFPKCPNIYIFGFIFD